MYQVTFSDQAMGELNRLDPGRQLSLMADLAGLPEEALANPREPLGRFHRDGRTYYRLRSGDHRCYFEIRDAELHVQYVLTRHSLTDFVFRAKLPVSEDSLVERHQSFWQYLESLQRKP